MKSNNTKNSKVWFVTEIANKESPPVHLFLGQDACDLAYSKMKTIKGELEEWKELITSTGY